MRIRPKYFRQMEEFNLRSNSFEAYVERANFYFEANAMEEKQLVVFLSSIGGKPINS